MKNNGLSMFLRQFALILLLVPCFNQICLAETLYERSTAQFNAKAQKARPNDYTFVVLGDSRDGEAVFKQALRLAKSFQPLFILHGGDYSGYGGEGDTARFLQLLKKSVPEIPFFVVMGNHEDRPVFVKEIGPVNFAVESKRLGLTLVAVDNSDNALRRTELDYLRSHLASAGASAFVAMHVPPKTENWRWHTFTDGADELKGILANGRAQGVFFSHVHLFARSEYGGVPAFITGGAGAPLYTGSFPGEPVHHILVVRVIKGKASYTMVPLSK